MKVFRSLCIILARWANYVLPIMFMMALSGCPDRPVGTYKTFPLTVVLADKLVSSAEDPLPKEAIKLVSPVYGKECNSGFIPRVRFLRADREPPEGVDLEPVEPAKLEKEIKQQRESEPMGWVRNMLEQKSSLEEIQKAISQSLKKVKSGGILAAEGTEGPQFRAAITTLFQEKQAAGMLVLLPSEKDANEVMQHLEQALPEGLSPTQVANEDALTQAAGKVLCKQAASVSGTSAVMELPGLVVVYKPRFTDGGISQKSPPPRPSLPKPPQEDLEEALASVRQDLEEGRLSKALKAVTALYAEHPQDAEIGRLKEEIEQKIRSRIEVKLLGAASGTHILDAQVALVALSGREASFRFYVEPYEDVYFYLYGIDQVGSLRVLFPVLRASGGGSNPLLAKQAYWVPSEIPEQGFPLYGEEGQIEEITMVTSRWPARELEEWGATLAGAGGEEASHHLRQALKERQEAQVGGCDVRTLQFAR